MLVIVSPPCKPLLVNALPGAIVLRPVYVPVTVMPNGAPVILTAEQTGPKAL